MKEEIRRPSLKRSAFHIIILAANEEGETSNVYQVMR